METNNLLARSKIPSLSLRHPTVVSLVGLNLLRSELVREVVLKRKEHVFEPLSLARSTVQSERSPPSAEERSYGHER